jgi:hypothetical protein
MALFDEYQSKENASTPCEPRRRMPVSASDPSDGRRGAGHSHTDIGFLTAADSVGNLTATPRCLIRVTLCIDSAFGTRLVCVDHRHADGVKHVLLDKAAKYAETI